MDGVGFDAFGQFLADRAGFGVCRVGCAHDVAVALHGVFAFQNLHDDGAADHEINQFAEEGALFVHGVEAFGLFAAHVDALGSNDAQAGFFQHLGDRTGQVTAGCVGLDDRKGAGNRHGRNS